jgi:hypothetical protein
MGARGARSLLIGLLLAAPSHVLAQTSEEEAQLEAEGMPEPLPPMAAEPLPPAPQATGQSEVVDLYHEPEHPLVPADHVTSTPPNWNGDIGSEVPGFILQRIQEHRYFVQPFLINSVFPEISARLQNAGGANERTGSGQFTQLLYGSIYVFDFYAPLLNIQEATPTPSNHFRMDLKAPIVFGNQVLTGFIGMNVPTSGPWTTNGGYNAMLGYAYGSRWWSFQARGGIGVDQLVGETVAPIASSFLADVTASFPLGRHADLLLEADGRKLLSRQGGTLRFWPGFRFFPLQSPSFTLALGAEVWLDSFNATGAFQNAFTVRNTGGYLELGYVFF